MSVNKEVQDKMHQMNLASMENNINNILANLQDAQDMIQRNLEYIMSGEEGTRFVDIVADIQKEIIRIPGMSQVHYLTQIAHKLES